MPEMIRKWIKQLNKESPAPVIAELAGTDDWQHLLSLSENQALLLFKHSSRCSLSDMALTRVLNQRIKREAKAPLHIINVVKNKALSRKVAADLGIVHESPQVIVLYRRRAEAHASHNAITASWICSALQGLNP